MDAGVVRINDRRQEAEFRTESFSGFKSSNVRKALRGALAAGEIEAACFWAAELVCSLKVVDLWEDILLHYGSRINVGSPIIALYLCRRIDNFKRIVQEVNPDGEATGEALRNSYDIRRLFAEIVVLLCMSRRRSSVYTGRSVVPEEFNIQQMSTRLRAKSNTFGKVYMQAEDPSEMCIPINELAFHLRDPVGDLNLACYWVDWLITFVAVCKKRKHLCVCERRSWAPVPPQFQKDPIWLVWETLRGESEHRSPRVRKLIDAHLTMYSLRFSEGVKRKRKHIVYAAIAYIFEPERASPSLCRDGRKLAHVKDRIDLIYAEVKKHEKPNRPTVMELDALSKQVS